ncbi:MAG: helix-turn-helix transcriptional regulator, partial [Chloroflexi bacterium]|nr:helix-turn-helix transcriptional regulator [Chloroflexota bacterium]
SLMKTAQGQETALRYLAEQQTREAGLGTEAPEEPESEQPDADQWGELALTPREQEVMKLLAKNASDKAIARRLTITERAVKGHVSRIRYMLRVSSRRQVVEYAKHVGGVPKVSREATLNASTDSDPGGPRAESGASIDERPHEPEASPANQESDVIVGDVVLVISPPLEPVLLIRLHGWLKEVVMADVDQTVGSWGEDTLLKSSLRTPMPLLRMLTELP